MCDKIINDADSVLTNVTNTIPTNITNTISTNAASTVSVNSDDKTVRYILHMDLLVIILLLIIPQLCELSNKYNGKDTLFVFTKD